MVSQQRPLAVLLHKVDALNGIGPVADHIAQAHHHVVANRLRVREDRVERGLVCMNVADDGDAQRWIQ